MKPFYKNVITSINDIEEDLKLQKNKHAELVKKPVNYVSLPDLIYLIIPIMEYIYKSPN